MDEDQAIRFILKIRQRVQIKVDVIVESYYFVMSVTLNSHVLFILLSLFQSLTPLAISASPLWSGSDLYQSDTITVNPAAKDGKVNYNYNKAFSGSTLNVCFGYQSMTQSSQGSNFAIEVTNGRTTKNNGGTLSYKIGSSTSITAFSVRYLAISSSVKTISTYQNHDLYFANFNVKTKSGSGTRTTLYTVNFTFTTGMKLKTSNKNVMLLFVQNLDMKTNSGGSYQFSTSVTFLNANQYRINLTAYGSTAITKFYFSRMIYDETAIQSSQTTYLDGGILISANSNYDLLKRSFEYMNDDSFMIGLCYLSSNLDSPMNWNFDIGSVSTSGSFQFQNMALLYWNYRYRNCPTGFPFFNETDNLCYDSCYIRYFEETGDSVCLPCHNTCLTCSSNAQNGCITCSTVDDFRESGPGSTCVCIAGYYDAGSRVCSQCQSTCVTCNNPTSCTSCHSSRVFTSGQCLCKAGQIDTGTTSCVTCTGAIPGCKNCSVSGTAVSCILCDTSQQMSLSGGVCVCQSGYAIDVGVTDNCKLCSSYTNMAGCSVCSSNSVCTQCKTTEQFYLSGIRCQCLSGYFLDSGVCTLCSSVLFGCLTCSDGSTCLTCKSTIAHLYSLNNECLCPAGYYQSNSSNVHTCQPCNLIQTGCLTCNDSSYCLTCDSALFIQSEFGDCQCMERYFGSPGSCAPCMDGCLECTSSSDCSNCDSAGNREWDNVNSECQCLDSFFSDGNTCKLCLTTLVGCTKCQDGTACDSTGCNATLGFQYNLGPECQCMDGYYLNGNLCSPCQPGCSQCSVFTACSGTCSLGYTKISGSCQCDSGYTLDPSGTICISCDRYSLGCTSCSGSGTGFSCSGCSTNGMILVGGKCQCQAGMNYYDPITSQCTSSGSGNPLCPWDTYTDPLDFSNCVDCPAGCTSCSDGSSCSSCDVTASYYLSGGTCLGCSPNCKICDNYLTCILCEAPFIAFNNGCQCPNGEVMNPAGTSCTPCSSTENGCKQCTPTNQYFHCYSCYDDFTLNPETGICQCTIEGYLASASTCSGCGIIGCGVCADQTTCQSCNSSSFFTAPIVSGHCSCIDGYYYNATHQSCHRCTAGCLSCSDQITCGSCDNSKFYVTSSTTPNTCVCRQEYYPDNGICSPCSSGCLQCSSDTSCTTCDTINNYSPPDATGSCNCKDGYYYESSSTMSCQPCSMKYLGCSTCNDSFCTTCDTSLYTLIQTPTTTQCECKFGLFFNGITCQNCVALFNGCLDCEQDNCTTCDATSHYVWEGNDVSQLAGCVCDPLYFYIGGGCTLCSTLITGCGTCMTPTICSACQTEDNFVFDSGSGNCICKVGYFLNATDFICRACTSPMPGCLECSSQSLCTLCDSTKNYQFNPLTNNCECELLYFQILDRCLNCSTSCQCDGYSWEGPVCTTKCGDRVIIYETQECDDGNLEDDDGCSSDCKVQDSFLCTNGHGGSFCSYSQPIEFTLLSLSKDKYCNCLIFKFDLFPQLKAYSSLNFQQLITPTLPLFNGSSVYSEGTLTLKYEYNSTLEGENVTFFFFPSDSAQFQETPASTFEVELILPSNEPIVVYDDFVYQHRFVIGKLLTAVFVASYALFLLGPFCNKIIGLEVMGVLQIANLVMADMKLVNPILAPFLYFKYAHGFNLEFQIPGPKLPIPLSALTYSSMFINNCNLVPLLPVLMLIISAMTYAVGRILKSGERAIKISKHILKQGFLTTTLFTIYNIAFSAGLQFNYRSAEPLETKSLIATAACLCFPVICISLLLFSDSQQFGEFKNRFRNNFNSQSYFVINIVYRGTLGYLISSQMDNPSITIVNVFLSILFLLYLLSNTPYRDGYHNYRSIFMELSTLVILSVGMYYRSMKSNLNLEAKSQLLLPGYLQITIVTLATIMSCSFMGYQLFHKLKRFFKKEKKETKGEPAEKKEISNIRITEEDLVEIAL